MPPAAAQQKRAPWPPASLDGSPRPSSTRDHGERSQASRAVAIAKRERTGRMQFPEKTAGIPDGSGWFRMVRDGSGF